jgi:hypothetical protein
MQGKINRSVVLQFALMDSDGFTRIEGADLDGFVVEVWIDDGAGGRVLADPEDDDLPAWRRIEATVDELGNGEYSATFTPLVPRVHYVIVRHAATSRDWCETVMVAVSDLTDLALIMGAGVTGLPA